MSDEKLSEGLEENLQHLCGAWMNHASSGEPVDENDKCELCDGEGGITQCLASNFRPLLARLERERDEARSETLEEAAALCKRRAIWLRTEILDTFRTEATNYTAEFLLATADRILELTPSIVSQPSRERTPHEEVIYQSGRLHGLTDAMTDPAMNKAREREVLEARHEALEDAAKMVEGLKYPYPVLTTQGMLDHIAKRIRNLTATPASTGEQS
jgi:hypothetical protein